MAALILAAAGLAGCGLNRPAHAGPTRQLITEHFGSRRIGSVGDDPVHGSDTVLSLLKRSFTVQTGPGGSVMSIGGVSPASAREQWSFYVNGVRAATPAARTAVHTGDRIWWDLHDARVAASVPAVVGSFPEPFASGIGGRRYPTTLECASDVAAACAQVGDALGRAGVVASTQQFGTGSGTDSLNVLVATWSTLRAALVADLLDKGPSVSGIYARFADGGRALSLLDPAGRVVRTLHAGAGLVASTADVSGTPTWLVTGTDATGVRAAAALLTASALDGHFAVAVQGATRLALPRDPGS